MKIGYVRISTMDQNSARQEEELRKLGVERVFIDSASGKSPSRPQLQAMMDFVRDGDTVIVESFSRFARNTRDLLALTRRLSEKCVEFKSLKEAIDTETPAGKFMLTVFAAVAELEHEYMLERQREGIAIAKKAGKYKGRSRIKLDSRRWQALYTQWKNGDITAVYIQRELGISASTFYRRVREFEQGGNKLDG